MKRYLWTSIILIVLGLYSLTNIGCMTANQLAAEKMYYESKAAMTNQKNAAPLFQIVAQDKDKPIIMQNVASLTVFAPPSGNDNQWGQYQHRDFTPNWIAPLMNAVAPLGILYGGSLLLKATNSSTTTSTYNNVTGSSNSTTLGGTISNATATPTVVNPVVVTPK
jgi:nucleoside-specific outer membrane channel protein Tsx